MPLHDPPLYADICYASVTVMVYMSGARGETSQSYMAGYAGVVSPEAMTEEARGRA
jgi:hypothetical protein